MYAPKYRECGHLVIAASEVCGWETGGHDGAGEEDKKRSIKMHIVDILSAGRVLMSH